MRRIVISGVLRCTWASRAMPFGWRRTAASWFRSRPCATWLRHCPT